jgi:ABC-type Fe3+/spermidine/putrescine transport system ATPase subunit
MLQGRECFRAPMAAVALELRGVSKRFGSRSVLDGIDLSIAKGKLVCLSGPSGCGKTTLLNLVAGLLKPNFGTIKIDGVNAEGIQAQNRNLGYVFQTERALFDHMSVFDNVAYPFRFGRRTPPHPDIHSVVNDMLQKVGLEGHRSYPVSKLSGGLKQRLAITRVLVYRPAIILLDEPLNSIDHHRKEDLIKFLRELRETREHTFLYVTHDDREVAELADDVAVLTSEGALDQFGTYEEVRRNPASENVRQILRLS